MWGWKSPTITHNASVCDMAGKSHGIIAVCGDGSCPPLSHQASSFTFATLIWKSSILAFFYTLSLGRYNGPSPINISFHPLMTIATLLSLSLPPFKLTPSLMWALITGYSNPPKTLMTGDSTPQNPHDWSQHPHTTLMTGASNTLMTGPSTPPNTLITGASTHPTPS